MTVLPPSPFTDSSAQMFLAPDEAAVPADSQSPVTAADIPDDLKQRLLAAIEADFRVYVVDLDELEAALYAPPDVRADTFEQHIARLDELIDEQPMPIFMQRTG